MFELLQEWLDWQMVSRQFARQQGMPLIAGIPDRFQCAPIPAAGGAVLTHLLRQLCSGGISCSTTVVHDERQA